jgi:CRISPR-associated endonuclease Cas2
MNKQNKLEEEKFRSGELRQIILAGLGIALVLGGSIVLTPNFPIILGGLIKIVEEIKGIKIPKIKIRRALKRLEKRKIIALEQKGKEVEVKVLKAGKIEVLKYSIKRLLELKSKKKKWKGKWFLVIFDVPEEERNKRDYLRDFLREIGFFQYQQSVYVYPYECEKEVGLIKKMIEGGKYISYIVAEKLERENLLKNQFGLV